MGSKEKYIKDSLKGHESDLDIQGLWIDLEDGLNKQERKRRGIWFFLFPGLAILSLVIGSVYFFYNKNTGNNAIVKEEISKGTIATPIDNKHKIETKTVELEKQATKTTNNINTAANVNSATNIEGSTKSNKTKTTIINKLNDNKIVIANSADLKPEVIKTSSNSGLEFVEEVNENGNKNFTAPIKLKGLTNKINDIESTNINEVLSNEIDEANIIESKTSTPDKDKSLSVAKLDLLPSLDLTKLDNDLSDSFKELPVIKKKGHWTFGINGGSVFTKLNYSTDQSDPVKDVIDRRLDSEKLTGSIAFGFTLDRTLAIKKLEQTRHQVSIISGLSYLSNKFVFKGEEEFTEIKIEPGVESIIENIDGTFTQIIGDVTTTTTKLRRVRKINSISTFQIPLSLKYSYRISPKVSFNIQNGIAFNRLSTYEGTNFITDGTEINIDKVVSNIEGRQYFASYLGGLGFAYQLNKRLSLTGHLFYSHSLQDISIENALRANVNSFGGKLGITHQF